jgi:hypothetical protein
MTDTWPEEPLMLSLDMIELAWPERFWMATPEYFPSLEEAGLDDDAQDYPDSGEIRWHALGVILTEVGEALATGRYTYSDDVSDTIEIPVHTTPADGLTQRELQILESWSDESVPTDDPWADNLSDGKHRLWAIWKHHPEAVIPIRSNLLTDAADMLPAASAYQATALAVSIRAQATTAHRHFTPEFRRLSPLYVDAIDKARSITAP